MMALAFNSIHSASVLRAAGCLARWALRAVSPLSAHLSILVLAKRVTPTQSPPLEGSEIGKSSETQGRLRRRPGVVVAAWSQG